MYKVSNTLEMYSEDEKKQISELSEKVSKEELINIIYRLSELEGKMKVSTQKTIIFETEIIKLCVKLDTKGLEDRIKNLEDKIESGNINVVTQVKVTEPVVNTQSFSNTQANAKVDTQEQTGTKTVQSTSKLEKSLEKTNQNIAKLSPGERIDAWQTVISNIKSQGKVMLYANLINTEAVQINDMTVAIRFNNGLNDFRKDLIGKPENMNVLNKEIAIICGKPMQIKLEDASGEVKPKQVQKQVPNIPTLTEQKEEINPLDELDIPINYIDEE